VLKIQLVHHIAHDTGEQLALHDGEEFVVGLPKTSPHSSGARLFYFSVMARASCVMTRNHRFAPAVRLPPIATATAPAADPVGNIFRLTPPVGINDAWGVELLPP